MNTKVPGDASPASVFAGTKKMIHRFPSGDVCHAGAGRDSGCVIAVVVDVEGSCSAAVRCPAWQSTVAAGARSWDAMTAATLAFPHAFRRNFYD